MTTTLQKFAKSALSAAADFLEPPGRWTQGTFGRNAKGGGYVSPTHPDCACCCAMGAIQRVAPDSSSRFEAERILSRVVGGSIVSWNDADGRTQAEVVQKMREAAHG